MATPRILLLSFFTVFCFAPLSSSTLVAKALSIFDYNRDNTAIVSSAPINQQQKQRSNKSLLGDDVEDVVVLTEKNFTEFMARNRYVMVNFYVPWCSWSKKLAPEYAAAATILKSRAVLAEVDCTAEAGLGRKFRINGYPTMYFFVGGEKKILYEVTLERTRNAIANWLYQKMDSAVRYLTSIDEAKRVLASNSLIVLAFQHSLQGEESEVLAAVAKQNIDVNFYQTANAEVAKLFHIETQIKLPALVMLERESGIRTHFDYEGRFTVSAIANFVSTYKLPSVITFTIEDAPKIFKNPMKQLWLFTPEYSVKVISVFKEVAKIFNGKLVFVHVDTSDEAPGYGRQLSYEFGITGVPTVVTYDAAMSKHHVYQGELTISDIKLFAKEFLEDKFPGKSDPSMKTLLRLPSHSNLADPSSVPHAY